ncbi:DUF1758 domain-containing protein [Trichonephila clavata]|uniref:DUF1758 domain-containing protein n=1 Tax=Trichonephila clavata TaxID=2740835 RepID=A0A8X6KGQ7_TRICU|nr:DUF1758 domain-containing protein [Trichonephila clavata]
MESVRLLNRKRGNLRGQLTKLAKALAEETPTDPAELQAKLDSIVKLQEKFELLKDEYYRTIPEEDFEEIESSLAEMDDEMQKIESSCLVCKKSNHHTLLHKYPDPLCFESLEDTAKTQVQFADNCQPSQDSPVQQHMNSNVSFFISGNAKSVLINTAIVYVTDSRGQKRPLRAILDNASENYFITTDASRALGLKIQKIHIPICVLNNSVVNVSKGVTAQLVNENDNFKWGIDLLIIPKITDVSPTKKIDVSNLKTPKT